MSSLSGRIALITGASSGIGRSTAVEFARRGARVAVNYPSESKRKNAEATRAEIADATDRRLDEACLMVRADVSNANEVESMFASVAAEWGTVDVLVNNAGIQIQEPASHETTAEDFDRVLAVNLRGPFLCSREAIRGFLDREPEDGRPRGVIVNVSSVHQRIPRPFYLSYAVSKYGLHGLTQTLALEYADRGIRVNSVAPGATLTPIQSWQNDDEMQKVVRSHIPTGRIASPEEIARIIAFLASDDAAYVTGETLFADGGLTLYPNFQKPWSG